MFLNRTLFHIQNWRKALSGSSSSSNTSATSSGSSVGSLALPLKYPVITWKSFVEQIRDEINPLASDDHLYELMQQLQLMGEIVFIKSRDYSSCHDLICYKPEWLCSQILGRLFEHQRYYFETAKPQNLIGIYTMSQIRDLFQDVCVDVDLLRQIFVSMDLCAQVEGNLEFAAFNFLSEPMPLAFHTIKNAVQSQSTSSKTTKKSTLIVFNGFQIKCSTFHLDKTKSLTSTVSNNLMTASMTSSSMFQSHSTPTLCPSQLPSIFFRIQSNLRSYLSSTSGVHHHHQASSPSSSSSTASSSEHLPQSNPLSKVSPERPTLQRNQSKLDSLDDSSYPSTSNNTTNILESPSLSSTNSPTRKIITNASSNGALIDVDIYQTRYCSRLTRKLCGIECLLSLDHLNGDYIELRACAPESWREELFYFVQDLYALLEQIMRESFPNLNLERHYLQFAPVFIPHESNSDGVNFGLAVFDAVYSPREIIFMQLQSKANRNKLCDLICCGSEKIESLLVYGIDLAFSQINGYTSRMLCAYLDKVDPMGRDWSILAFLLGLQDVLPNLELKSVSKCECVLQEWCKARPDQATVRYLISKIADLDRKDVYDLILNTCGLFQMKLSTDSGIQNSNQTLASIK
jgi:hypothetical protein